MDNVRIDVLAVVTLHTDAGRYNAFLLLNAVKAWMPTDVGMTEWGHGQ